MKKLFYAEDPTCNSLDRVRHSTPFRINKRIDCKTDANIQHYSKYDHNLILKRIQELDREWDIERILEVNASALALTGLVTALAGNRKWLVLPLVVLPFLFIHGVQGWCPPLPLLRRLGVRTRGEIDREKYALKALIT